MRSNVLAKVELCAAVLLGLSLSPAKARADLEDPFGEPSVKPHESDAPPTPARTPRSRRGYQHWLGGLYVGRGLRFNNPYRLQTVLGDDPESLSLTATYLDLHLGRTFGAPDGFEHGIAAHFSVAIQGIRQEVLTPSYLLLHRFGPRFLGYGRAGFPIVLEPDASLGLEAGLGGAYFLSASLGLGAELDFSVFYGAATIEEPSTVIPVMSLAFGVFFDWERLP
jgi:hypothetical protein